MKTIILSTAIGLLVGAGSVFFMKRTSPDFSQQLVNELTGSTVIAEYQGGVIKASDVEAQVKPHFAKVRSELLQHYIKAAELELVRRFQDRFTQEVEPVSEAELTQYMKANRIAPDKRSEIENFLAIEKQRIQNQLGSLQLLQDLQFKNKLGAASFEIENTDAMPSKGSSSPTVTVQVFCDFGNPMCGQARVTMEALVNQFKEKVKWVYRHFPVASNQIGDQASLISLCAQEQNKFWVIHDLFYDRQNTLNQENMLELALSSGVNADELNTCLQTERPAKILKAEKLAAEALGLTMTPVFFINGQKVTDIEKVASTVQSLL